MPDHLHELLELTRNIRPKERKYVLGIIEKESIKIRKAPGGLYKHQNWKGGYIDHLTETMSVACILFDTMNKHRRLSFSLSDALYVLFLHDLEKLYRLTVDVRERPVRTELASNPNYRSAEVILKRLKIPTTKTQRNALKYAEGEKQDYHPTKRVMNPLAAFVHCCDTISARIWFDEPKKSGLLKIKS